MLIRSSAWRRAAWSLLAAAVAVCAACRPAGRIDAVDHEKIQWPSPDEFPPTTVVVHSQVPAYVPLADPSCSPTNALARIGKIPVWVSADGVVKQRIVDLSEVSGATFSHPALEKVVTDVHVQEAYRDCTPLGANTYRCQGGKKLPVATGRHLAICQAGGYPRDSIENIALVAAASIIEAYEQVRRLRPDVSQGLARVALLVQPRIEVTVSNGGQQLASFDQVDNAFWTFQSSEPYPYFISMLPHSRRYRDQADGALYYEQQAVIMHEYTHHLFFHLSRDLFGHQLQAVAVSNNPGVGGRLFSAEMEEAVDGTASQNSRKVGFHTVVTALNEGVADFVAYQVMEPTGPGSGNLVLGSARHSRNIGSPRNDDGQDKALTTSVIKHFFSERWSGPESSLTPDHQDVHTIGAVLGHGLDAIYSQRGYGPQEKLALVLDWLRRINREVVLKPYSDGRHLLEDLVEIGVGTAVPAGSAFTAADCSVIAAKFPVYSGMWKVKGFHGC